MNARQVSGSRFVGPSARKDEAQLAGRDCFVGDVMLPGMLHVAFACSAIARRNIPSIDISAARALPGVRAVIVRNDMIVISRDDRVIEPSDHFPSTRSAKSKNRSPRMLRRSDGQKRWSAGDLRLSNIASSAVAGCTQQGALPPHRQKIKKPSLQPLQISSTDPGAKGVLGRNETVLSLGRKNQGERKWKNQVTGRPIR